MTIASAGLNPVSRLEFILTLGGMVAITANCNAVTPLEAILIGSIAGIIVFGGVNFLAWLKIDDVVGAFPVHGGCGIWGGIACAFFGDGKLGVQLLGISAIVFWTSITSVILFSILKGVRLLRATKEEEEDGLDVTLHGESAYTLPYKEL